MLARVLELRGQIWVGARFRAVASTAEVILVGRRLTYFLARPCLSRHRGSHRRVDNVDSLLLLRNLGFPDDYILCV